jgi:MFS family permease
MGLTVQLLYAVPFSEVTVFGALVARSEFKMTAAGAQFCFTLFFATSLLSRLLVARLSPIKGKRRVFISAAVLTVAGTAMLAHGGSAWGLVAAMVLLGIPHGVTFPLALALIANSSAPERLAAANAALFATTNAVSVVAPLVLGAVASAAGYRIMSAAVLVPVTVFMALLLLQRPPR